LGKFSPSKSLKGPYSFCKKNTLLNEVYHILPKISGLKALKEGLKELEKSLKP
jgi:hypothetical protein